MSADWSTPGLSDAYADVLALIDERLDDVLVGFDPAVVTPTNFPTNAVRWTSASNKWQKWDGGTWNDLTSTYAISISGNAGTATGWATGRTLTLSGDASGTSSSWDGTGNATLTVTLATVAVAKGGTNITSYTIGDLLYASGTTTLSKLADVATGNALISGGVGTAPAWGKIALTTHVSDTLPVANGGSGRTSHTAYSVICGGTGTTTAQQSVASVGSAGQVLTSQGAGALPTWGDVIESGTRMLFQQTSAPTGWTKDTTATYNDASVRLTTGTVTSGGADAFSSTFGTSKSTASYTLTTADIPSHTHTFTTGGRSAAHTHSGTTSGPSANTLQASGAGGTLGGGTGWLAQSHTHSITTGTESADHTHSGTTNAAGSGGGHSHSLSNFNIKYTDFIIATKD